MPELTVTTTVDIDASATEVWDVLVDFASYDQWSPVLRIEGTATVGTKLVVHMGAMSFKPKVLKATPNQELRWLGRLGFGGIADGEHYFILSTNTDGTTRLDHGEHFSGILVALAKGKPGQADNYDAFSRALKRRVETQ